MVYIESLQLLRDETTKGDWGIIDPWHPNVDESDNYI
jgi:hypothetical protein